MSESHLESIGSQRIERLVQFRVKPDADLLRTAKPELLIFFSKIDLNADCEQRRGIDGNGCHGACHSKCTECG